MLWKPAALNNEVQAKAYCSFKSSLQRKLLLSVGHSQLLFRKILAHDSVCLCQIKWMESLLSYPPTSLFHFPGHQYDYSAAKSLL